MSELIAQLQDFRHRVLQADKLHRQGDTEGAKALMPSKEELVQAIKAYRATIGQRAPARAASAKAKSKAAEVLAMDPKNLLD